MARGVIPAQAGTQLFGHFPLKSWIPALPAAPFAAQSPE
jgi:hypothetical protein